MSPTPASPTPAEAAREWLSVAVFVWNEDTVASLTALLEARDLERDRMWCRALTTEDPTIVQRVTHAFNELRKLVDTPGDTPQGGNK